MTHASLGPLELEVLRYLTDHPEESVREVTQEFGEPRGLARTTMLTVMENLRAKGHLVRRREGNAFRYSPKIVKADLLRNLLRDFVENTLKGSVSTVVTYLAGQEHVSDTELDQLEALVEKLRAERRQQLK